MLHITCHIIHVILYYKVANRDIKFKHNLCNFSININEKNNLDISHNCACIFADREKAIHSPYESHDSNSLERLSDRVSKWCVSVSGQTDARHRPSAVTGRRRFRACHSIFSCYAPYYVFLRFRRCDQFYKRET